MLLKSLIAATSRIGRKFRKDTNKMMVDCDKSLELLSDLRDGLLAESEMTLIRAHLDGCVGCKDVFIDIELIVSIASTLHTENGLAYPDEEILWQRIGVKRSTVH